MNQSPIYTAIQQLISQGRLTGVTAALKLDGASFVIEGDDTVDPEAGKWRADGTSEEVSPWGGRQLKAVEDLRKTLPPERAAAMPQWFVRPDDTSLDPKQNFTASQNNTERLMMRMLVGWPLRSIATMYEYTPYFLKKGTKEPEWSFTPARGTFDHNPGGSNPKAGIPNHRLVVGEWTNDQIAEWARTFDTQSIYTDGYYN
jgi:hypothetical protein